jgi:hypothetical protein
MTAAKEEQAKQGRQGPGFHQDTPVQVEHPHPPAKLAQNGATQGKVKHSVGL